MKPASSILKKNFKSFLQLSSKERRFVRLIRRYIFLSLQSQKKDYSSITLEEIKKFTDNFFSQDKYRAIDNKTKQEFVNYAIFDQHPAYDARPKCYYYENYSKVYPPVESTAKVFSYFLSHLPNELKLLFIDSCDVLQSDLSEKLVGNLLQADFILNMEDLILQEILQKQNMLNLAKLVVYNEENLSLKTKIMKNLSKRNLNRFLKDVQFAQTFSEYENFMGSLEICGILFQEFNSKK